MKWLLRIAFVSILLALPCRAAWACEEYRSLTNSELKEFRDKLVENGADPLDRLFAFEELACSDMPTIRSYAMREGLNSAKDPIVRHQILFETLMQKSRIDIELNKSKNLKDGDKRFYEKHSGVLSINVTFKDRSAGCIGLYFDRCAPQESIFIKGDVVEFNHGYVVGLFKLTGQNELVGYIRPQDHPDYSNIPAIMRLF